MHEYPRGDSTLKQPSRIPSERLISFHGQCGEAQIHSFDVFFMLDSCTCTTALFHVFFTQRHADLRHPPHAHAVIFHPQTWCMIGPGHCRDSHGRSEVAEGDYIAPTVLIEGWLVSGPGGSSALLPCRIGVDLSQGQVNILVFFRSLTSMVSPGDQWLG